jgi:hypothetical protein
MDLKGITCEDGLMGVIKVTTQCWTFFNTAMNFMFNKKWGYLLTG